jgi:hypothetical protein
LHEPGFELILRQLRIFAATEAPLYSTTEAAMLVPLSHR